MTWWTAVVAIAAVLLTACTASTSPTATTTSMKPLATGTIAALPITTDGVIPPLSAQPLPSTTTLPPLARDTEVSLRRCVHALDDDFLPLTLKTSTTKASQVVALCDEATVQLEVEPTSEFVDTLLEQVAGAQRAIGFLSLSRTVTNTDAESLRKTLDGYVARINVRLDDMKDQDAAALCRC